MTFFEWLASVYLAFVILFEYVFSTILRDPPLSTRDKWRNSSFSIGGLIAIAVLAF